MSMAPLLPPLQETFVVEATEADSIAGWVIEIADAKVNEQPRASVTVTL